MTSGRPSAEPHPPRDGERGADGASARFGYDRFWYVVAESGELTRHRPVARQVLGEWLALFRDAAGAPAALRDRCLHRNARLSGGRVRDGCLVCPYHGWTYDGAGRVVAVPAQDEAPRLAAPRYAAREQDGYVYARLSAEEGPEPFAMPDRGRAGWRSLRLRNRFRAGLADCVENFIDIPHTAFVHAGSFRRSTGETLRATVTRQDGAVEVAYRGEHANLGPFARFLNPAGDPIEHTDAFRMPNVTHVRYRLGPHRHFVVTSQSVPVGEAETLVYTDIAWSFGAWTRLAAPLVRWLSQRVIDQDLAILAQQQAGIARYGRRFVNTPADRIHVLVDSIHAALSRGEDPRGLPPVTEEVEFRV